MRINASLQIDITAIFSDIIESTSYAVDNKEGDLRLFAADMALIRLRSAVDAVLFLSKIGKYVEQSQIIRGIFEQISWILFCTHATNEENIKRTHPQNSFSSTKEFLPDLARQYGKLSEISHMRFDRTAHYILFNQKAVQLSNVKASVIANLILLHAMNYIGFCATLLWPNTSYSKHYSENGRINDNSPSQEIYRQYCKFLFGSPDVTFDDLFLFLLLPNDFESLKHD